MSLPDWADTMEAARDYYDDLDRYEYERGDAYDPQDEMAPLDTCGGTGEVEIPCSGKHRWMCGGPDCDDHVVACPGCPDCEGEI